ncbi:MAG: selenocysteine-specific translation elongation factor [Anaerolinea sp.]|nr:selenocysteine-specific translation elongation factor [Anaerolinea sp.]
MRVVATAGHVDHGKSTLVKCLTGIDPDRLAEEKARAMTIDLGFAWLRLPNGEMLGIVDVPGHRDFIANMLAGMGGIDAALLVIAADEGVMPQTAEHLAILDLLGIERSLIILSKTDLIADQQWLDLVVTDIRHAVARTTLADAEIIPVSALTGNGIPHLVERLKTLLDLAPPHSAAQRPRLSIDRVFTMSGFGTVVTGTLQDGELHVGDEVEIQPSALRGRVRGLQSYKKTVSTALPGSRVAVNLAGVDQHALKRGDMLAYPGQIHATDLLDLRFRHLPGASRPLKHGAHVKLYVGAAEVLARVRLLDADELAPGQSGWIQLQLEERIAVAVYDRCILRTPSPPETIGGGIVVNTQPFRRWRRFQSEVIESLETRLSGTPAQRIAQAAFDPVAPETLTRLLGVGQAELDDAIAQGLVVRLSDGLLIAVERWAEMTRTLVDTVRTFHASNPLRLGIPREELRNRLALPPALLSLYLEHLPELVSEKGIVRAQDHAIRLDYAQQELVRVFFGQMDTPTPPTVTDARQMIGADLLYALIELGELVQIQPDVILLPTAYQRMVTTVLNLIDTHGSTTVGDVRDACQTSRKYALALLEHLDALGKTRRQGDTRVRGRG